MLKENLPIIRELNADKWNEKGYTGKGVKVVILDINCKPFSHMKKYFFDEVSADRESGHGADIGFAIHEIVNDIKVYAFNTIGNYDKTYNWLNKHKDEIDLINISMAGVDGRKTPEYEKLKDLEIPIICASGNDGFNDKLSYPANYDFTIGIGAWGRNNNGEFKVDRNSNGGQDLDAVAPVGIRILGENEKSWTSFGTSIASAIVTGMLSCYVQWRKESGLPKLKPEEARKFIRDNAMDIEDKGFDSKSGYGLFKLPTEVPQVIKNPEIKPDPAKKASEGNPDVYIVRKGNSVSGLAKKYGVSKEDIRKWNVLDSKIDKLTEGQQIYLKEPIQTFKDVPPTHPAYKEIEELYKLGLLDGKDNGYFKPEDKITRVELAKIIYEVINKIK